MKKVWLSLFLIVALVFMMAGAAAAADEEFSPDDPVSSEDDVELVEGSLPEEEPAADAEPVVDAEPIQEETAAGDEDFVRPDEEGEVGITAIGIEIEEGADIVATSIESEGAASGFPWVYVGAGAVIILPAAALFLIRRKASA